MELFLFQLLVFLFSIVIHEVSHGYAAERLGDPTARLLGRLTLNPLNHIDPIGSVVLPLVMAIPALFGGPPIIFGWAKPVPYNPHNLQNPKLGGGLIAAAGPASNFLLAAVFALLVRAMLQSGTGSVELLQLFTMVVFINILLAVFNLLPIPPLDGSKVLAAILPESEGIRRLFDTLEQYGFMILLVLIFAGGLQFIYPVIFAIFRLFTGTGGLM